MGNHVDLAGSATLQEIGVATKNLNAVSVEMDVANAVRVERPDIADDMMFQDIQKAREKALGMVSSKEALKQLCDKVLSNLASDQSVKVSFTSDHKAYLSNSNDDRVIINAGTFLAGYRSGKWKPAGQEMDDDDVPYELVDGDSWVMHEGKFCRLLDVVIERRASKPDNATVAYYTIADRPTPDEPSMFVLNPKTESSLAFRPNMQDVKVEPGSKVTITQTHAAICLPPKVWAKFQQVKILWMSSWTQLQGLKPKRPMMVFVATLELPGKSVALLA